MSVRNIYTKIVTNDDDSTVYEADAILGISIQRSITDGSAGIGYTQSDRLSFTVVAADKLPRGTRTTVYVKIDDQAQKRLGRFYVDECTRDGSTMRVTAYDKMYWQDKAHVRFNGKSSIGLAALTFPCKMQDVLDYICTLRGFSCDFVCEDFDVVKKPLKSDETPFTVRELLGFIAASHGCNAKFDDDGKLVFKRFEVSNKQFTASDVTDITIDDSEPYEVIGVQFTIDGDNPPVTILDGVRVYPETVDDDDVRIIRCYNALATWAIVNHAWSQINKLKYYGGSITQRGTGDNECGDLITVQNLKYPADTETYRMCITDITYSITPERGFMETLSSQVIKESGHSNGSVPANTKKSGVGENVGSHNERFNDYSGNTITGGDYNSASGHGNTLTNCQNTHCGGNGNTLDKVYQSAVFGDCNRFTSTQYSIVAGGSNKNCQVGVGAGSVDYSAVFGHSNSIFARLAHSLLCGSQNTVNGQVHNSIIASYLSTIYKAYCAIVAGEYADMPANNNYRIAIGNGSSGAPQNCFTVDSAGDVTARAYNTFGADYAEYFEWLDGNPDSEDRRGMLVTLNGDKLVPAHGDDFLGAVSACPSVVGNAFENYWHGKYKTDVFGAVLLDKDGKPIISDGFDPSRIYIPRSKRPEWSPIGLVGKLVITDNGKCKVGEYVSAMEGRGVPCNKRTNARVIRRVDERHVEITIGIGGQKW